MCENASQDSNQETNCIIDGIWNFQHVANETWMRRNTHLVATSLAFSTRICVAIVSVRVMIFVFVIRLKWMKGSKESYRGKDRERMREMKRYRREWTKRVAVVSSTLNKWFDFGSKCSNFMLLPLICFLFNRLKANKNTNWFNEMSPTSQILYLTCILSELESSVQ